MAHETKTYDEIFEKLINESENISVEYEHKNSYYKEDTFISFSIKSVNDCKTEYSFKNKVKLIAKDGLEIMRKEIQELGKEDKLAVLEDCSEQISWLKEIVEDKRLVFEENEYGPEEIHDFKAFVNATYKGTKDDKIEYYKLNIARHTNQYAKSWIEAIEETKQKIDFLINQTELLPDDKAVKDPNEKYLFYSWQSDRDSIRKQIWKALSKAKKDLKKEGITLHIDSDMRNSPGGQDIPTTLFGKIEQADIFIADVILTGLNTLKDEDKSEKLSPNPNVLIELGFAAGKIGWEKVVMILNTDSERIEDLPFDIRNRSILWYNTADTELLENKLIDYIRTIIKSS